MKTQGFTQENGGFHGSSDRKLGDSHFFLFALQSPNLQPRFAFHLLPCGMINKVLTAACGRWKVHHHTHSFDVHITSNDLNILKSITVLDHFIHIKSSSLVDAAVCWSNRLRVGQRPVSDERYLLFQSEAIDCPSFSDFCFLERGKVLGGTVRDGFKQFRSTKLRMFVFDEDIHAQNGSFTRNQSPQRLQRGFPLGPWSFVVVGHLATRRLARTSLATAPPWRLRFQTNRGLKGARGPLFLWEGGKRFGFLRNVKGILFVWRFSSVPSLD